MAEYDDLADLREELTVDDPDRRANAYGVVMGLDDDVQVSDVLGPTPDEETVEELVEGGVIPPTGPGGSSSRSAAERDEEIVALLRDILDELQTDAVAQEGEA